MGHCFEAREIRKIMMVRNKKMPMVSVTYHMNSELSVAGSLLYGLS